MSRFEVEDGVGAGAGLEPDVEDVHLLAELGVRASERQAVPAGRSCSGCVDVPGVGGLAGEEVDDGFVDGRIAEGLAAFAAEEDGDGDAPDALAGRCTSRGGRRPCW